MEIKDFIPYITSLPEYQGQIVHVERLAAHKARHGKLDRPLPPPLEKVLQQRGVSPLYAHQAESINAARQGYHVMVSTSTASGKTICYNVPVLEAILNDPQSRALYLYPTKALAQDQLRTLNELTANPGLKRIQVGTYDGDTPANTRSRLRKSAAILLSNPDMLHLGILPNHNLWATFFRHLRYVILDEAHVYRGIFGSHVACLMRRLRRVCALYGAQPQFILSSATIANPGELAARLVGTEAVVVEKDGAPQEARRFVFWNPPVMDRGMGQRRSINAEATWIFGEMVKQGIRNITFTQARKIAELILLYAREELSHERPDLLQQISAYRSGYLPEERREIERKLFSGQLLGVTATNALELGIDVGALDATVLVGYPGSIASTWQQAGRAGRGKREALTILIGQDDPLDQFFMRHPKELLGRPHEHALIDPGNPYVLTDHLTCAAREAPLDATEGALFGAGYPDAVRALERERVLARNNGRWYLAGDDYPAQSVNMRSTAGMPYMLVDETQGHRTLEKVDAATAMMRVYPGAIYLHQAESYLITRLDLQQRVAYARPVSPSYYTRVLETNNVQIIRSVEGQRLGTTELYWGRVRVTSQVIGFVRHQQYTEALLSEEALDLPPTSFETQSLWFEVPDAIRQEVTRRGGDFAGGLHAVEHACIGILPLFALCDRNDIGGLSTPAHPDTGKPQVFIYDGHPGGVGIAAKGYELIRDLWQRTLQVIRECPCDEGCPSCVQSPKCGNRNQPLDKAAAGLILHRLLG